jgi:hypothetical protein
MPIVPNQVVVLEQKLVEADSAEIGDYIEIKRKSKKLIFDLNYLKNGQVVKNEVITLEDVPAHDTRTDESLTVASGKVTLSHTPVTIVSVANKSNNETVEYSANGAEITPVNVADGVVLEVSYVYTVAANLAFTTALMTQNGQYAYGGIKAIAYAYCIATNRITGSIT